MEEKRKQKKEKRKEKKPVLSYSGHIVAI